MLSEILETLPFQGNMKNSKCYFVIACFFSTCAAPVLLCYNNVYKMEFLSVFRSVATRIWQMVLGLADNTAWMSQLLYWIGFIIWIERIF